MIPTPDPIQLEPRIRTTLAALRRSIRAYVWGQGLAAAAAAAGILFWLSLGIDWFFEPDVFARELLLAASLVTLGVVVYRMLACRALVALPDRAMAVLLERRFAEFDDGLLTAVELTERPPDANDCNPALLEATCAAASEPIGQIRLRHVFDLRPLCLALAAAVALALSVGTLRALAPEVVTVWFRRAVLMSTELWPRKTWLSVEGFADGVARVARGADFTLIALADTAAPEIPQSVRVSYRGEGHSRLEGTMIREGQARPGVDRHQEYSYTFRGVLAPIDLELRGGDARIRDLRIEVVDAPTLVRLDLECRYPSYTAKSPRTVPAAGVVPLPLGTEITIAAEANKPLVAVEIADGDQTQTVADGDYQRLKTVTHTAHNGPTDRNFSEELRACIAALRPRLGSGAAAETNARIIEELDQIAQQAEHDRLSTEALARLDQTVLQVGRFLSFSKFVLPLQPLAENKSLQITLSDADGITSGEPIRLTVTAMADQPPQPSVQLEGIGTAVTPQARLPFVGRVTDDYGVDRIWLEYTVEGQESRQETLHEEDAVATEVPVDDAFELADLALTAGQKLLLSLKASDRFDLAGGPNEGTGDRWMLDVVTADQLRTMLEAREIVLRQRFETIVEDVEDIRQTLRGLSFEEAPTEAAEAPAAGDALPAVDSPERRRAVRLLRIQRVRQNGQKDSHETLGVADAFSGIRQELVNNRVYTEELRIRLEEDIVAPLTRLAEQDFAEFDALMADLEKVSDDATRAPQLRDQAVARADAILRVMNGVLSRMIELEDFNEAVQLLRSILQEQEKLRAATDERRKEKLRQLLED